MDQGFRDRVAGIAEELDRKYFDLREAEEAGGHSTGWEELFRRARAASAVYEASGPDPLLAATEATYEALHALAGDADAILAVVESTR